MKGFRMKYDFTTIMDRRGHDALAVDYMFAEPKEGFDAIPMWVADMNYATAPAVIDAIRGRLEHGAFGYFRPRQEYYDEIISWLKRRKDMDFVTQDMIGYDSGVLGGVTSALKAFKPANDKVLIHAPTYTGFTGCLTNAGFTLVHSYLKVDENGIWRMDFEDMAKKIEEEGITAAVFCSPHNPCGRVWERWEVEGAMAVFEKHGVKVVSDEIWSDLILTGYKHTPTLSVSDYAKNNVAAMYAITKTYNLAGMVGSYHVVCNPELKAAVEEQCGKSHYNNMNVLSMYAMLGAYSPAGEEWLEELLQVLSDNVNYACDYINERFEGVCVSRPQGTYMLFPDFSGWLEKTGKTMDDLCTAMDDIGCMICDGRPFHGQSHLRINVALPKAKVVEAFERMDKYIFNVK